MIGLFRKQVTWMKYDENIWRARLGEHHLWYNEDTHRYTTNKDRVEPMFCFDFIEHMRTKYAEEFL